MSSLTFSALDEDAGLEASIVSVSPDDDGNGLRGITDVRVRTTNGQVFTGADLVRMLGHLGLRLLPAEVVTVPAAEIEPTPEPEPELAAPVPAKKTAPKVAKKAPPTVKGKALYGDGRGPKKGARGNERVYRVSPPLAELERVWVQCNASPTEMRDHYTREWGAPVPLHTVQGWLKRHRRDGHEFGSSARPPAPPAGTAAEPVVSGGEPQ